MNGLLDELGESFSEVRDVSLSFTLLHRIYETRFHVILQNDPSHLVQCRADSRDLKQDIWTSALLLHHLPYPADMPLYSREPIQNLFSSFVNGSHGIPSPLRGLAEISLAIHRVRTQHSLNETKLRQDPLFAVRKLIKREMFSEKAPIRLGSGVASFSC